MLLKQSDAVKNYFLLALLILVWGYSWPIMKQGLDYISPMWFVSIRLIIATFTMFAIVIAMRKFIWPEKKDIKIIFTIGLIQISLFLALMNIGLKYVDAGRSAILVYTTPIWVVPISVFFFHEKPPLTKWLGFILGIAGILVLFNPAEINWSDGWSLFGNAILLATALCWAIAMLCARHMQWHHTPLELISWQLLVGTIPIVLLTLGFDPQPIIQWNGTLLFSLFYNGILATSFAYWAMMVVCKEIPTITVSLSLLAVPVCGLLFSAWILSEKITHSIVLAMLFILGGLICVTLTKSRGAK